MVNRHRAEVKGYSNKFGINHQKANRDRLIRNIEYRRQKQDTLTFCSLLGHDFDNSVRSFFDKVFDKVVGKERSKVPTLLKAVVRRGGFDKDAA